MGTKAFIQAFIRFCNSYGISSNIYSDNARSFDNALGKDIIEYHLDSNEFRNNFISHTINHLKIPLYSPWMRSVCEKPQRPVSLKPWAELNPLLSTSYYDLWHSKGHKFQASNISKYI